MRKDLSRSKEVTLCKDQELKKFIQRWLKPLGWKFKNFAELLELLGIRQPINLTDFNKENMTFKCVTEKSEFKVFFRFEDNIYKKSTIVVDQKDGSIEYAVYYNYKKSKIIEKNDIFLIKRLLRQEGRELSCSYEEYGCKWSIVINKNDILTIEVNNYNIYAALGISKKIEKYLLSIVSLADKSTEELYGELLPIIVSNKDISEFKKILISHTDKVNKRNRLKSKILFENGEKIEYAVLKDEIMYYVNKNGLWKCIYKDIEIKGKVSHFNCKDLQKLMKGVKEQVSEMYKIF